MGTHLPILLELVNKSLISRSTRGGRYEIHELLRQFAEEQLKRSGELAAALGRHSAFFVAFVNARLPILQSRNPQAALDEIQADFDNIRQAVLYFLKQPETGAISALEQISDSLRVFFEAEVHFSASVRHPGLPYLSLRLFFAARDQFSADAEVIFRAALDRTATSETEATLREGLADALQVRGECDAAGREYEQARRLLPETQFAVQARLLRKHAQVFDSQRRLSEALALLADAEHMLSRETNRDETWWQEWIAIQNSLVSAYFFLGDTQAIGERADGIRTVVDRYGTPALRFDFYTSGNMIELLKNQFVVTDRAMEYARLGLGAALETGSLLKISIGHFRIGLTYFCLEQWSEAESEFQAGLAIADRVGNILAQTLCTTFMATMFRRCLQVEAVEHWATVTLQIAGSAGIDLYLAAAKANLAWVDWRRGQTRRAVTLAQEAMDIWERVSPRYPVRWQAQWILLGHALREGRLADGIDYGRSLFGQQALNDQVMRPLSKAISAWDSGAEDDALTHMSLVLSAATVFGYL
ncbi:MAG: hypothetical protein IPK19_30210 [Chloroflexi bacterium]|nr:hypothetical protein [Chloroflexota bacterium]